MEDIKLGIYRHFKGGIYEVVGVGRHSETLCDMVIYKNVESGEFWVRPAEMWNETVEYKGETVLRFTLVDRFAIV